MKVFFSTAHILILFLSFPSLILGQENNNTENSDEAKIISNWRELDYKKDSNVVVLHLPQRKFDPNFLCDELIRYKEGYIINSITSGYIQGKVEIQSKFYYYSEKDLRISQLTLPEADTIESIISDSINTLYCSYKKMNGQYISSKINGVDKDLLGDAPDEIKTQIDTAKWIKLGFYNKSLYALSPNALFTYSNNRWNQLLKYSPDSFYLKVLKYRRFISYLPTRNIVVTKDHVLFLQELVQGRRCRLFKLDIKTGLLSDFFISQDYIDNYMKEINDFSVLPDQSILVCMSRLWKNEMLLKVSETNTDVLVFQNHLNNSLGQENIVEATAILADNDTIFVAGTNGLFKMNNNVITPLVLWENGHQEIKEGKALYDFEFYPRCIIKLSDTKFLIGGMWGGLNVFDLNDKKVIYLDDISSKKIKSIEIDKL